MTVADDILASLFEFPDDIEGPAPERAAQRVYWRFVRPLEDKLKLADAVVVAAIQLSQVPYNEIHLHIDEADSEVRKLLLEIARATRAYSVAADHAHQWQDTGFANLDECSVCGETRQHPGMEF